jgi:predicted HD superfamily hydrolase involved in NAD metabolism
MGSKKIPEIKKWVSAQVSPKRYQHIQGVAQTAKKLAVLYGLSPDKAELAGWLHDCAKELSKGEMADWIKKGPFKLDLDEIRIPALWHPHAGASIALKKWGIKDAQVLEAIRRHTLGSPAMSPLASVLFVADFIEPGRKFDGVTLVRKIAKKSLSEAVLLKCSMTISYLFEKNTKVHGRLLDTWNYFLGTKNEK